MKVLQFKNSDGQVVIDIATKSIDNSLRRLKSRVGEFSAMHYCDYRSSCEGELLLSNTILDNPTGKEWKELPPVMFETSQYNFTLSFSKIVGHPTIIHPNKELAESFQWFAAGDGGYLMAPVDFLNEPGIFRLQYQYTPQGEMQRTEWLEFRVVSPKLDTKRDLLHMLRMINAEYENLVFKYLTKTFQTFGLTKDRSNNLIWLSIFKNIIDEYITALQYITNRPNMRGERNVYYDKADRIKHWTPRMSLRYAEEEQKGTLEHYKFRHEMTEKTMDTKENRFVKYTVKQIGKRLSNVMKELRQNYQDQLQNEELEWLDDKGLQLEQILHHRLWRQIGEFRGMRQESSVLHKRTGYSQVYRLWYILQSGLGFFEGSTEVGVRPIWELYELWCFLKMKQMVAQCLDIDVTNPDHVSLITENPKTMLSPFSDSSVEHVITYQNRFNGDEVELRYQHTYNRRSGEVHTATTEQRPDIVLNIRKADNFVLTYLYDAKYRVMDDKNKDVDNLEADYDIADYPPPDALNQMHRYRDAIYYGNKQYEHTAKEIIGGYILFPGRYRKENGKRPYYINSIDEINIGACPLLPNADEPETEGAMLYEHLHKILREQTTYEQIVDTKPQKGLDYDCLAFVGVVPNSSQFLEDFEQHEAAMYYTGKRIKLDLDVKKIAYFVPHVHGRINGYYLVEAIKPASKKDKLKNGDDDEGIRLFFELGEYIPFGEEDVLYPYPNGGIGVAKPLKVIKEEYNRNK